MKKKSLKKTHYQTKNLFTPNDLYTIKKNAFTLAEVLITLGIIGVVAALTVPSLINKIQRKELQTKFKKAYSELSQINEEFKADLGVNMCEYAWEYNKSYGNGVDEGDWGVGNLNIQMQKYLKVKFKLIHSWYPLYTLNNNQGSTTLFDDGGINKDPVGRIFFFEYARESINKCPLITVDLNGEKAPNKFGYDIFSFRPTKNGRIIAMGNVVYDYDDVIGFGDADTMSDSNKFCSLSSNEVFNGLGCAYWASIDKHPSDENKDYWNDFLK